MGVPAGYLGSTLVERTEDARELRRNALHGHHSMGQDHPDTEATEAFREAATRMHADMGASYSGDVDLDFARGMVPHHQGAIDMARIELRHGRDPAMRSLAQTVVRTQNAEIALMLEWIARHSGKQK